MLEQMRQLMLRKINPTHEQIRRMTNESNDNFLLTYNGMETEVVTCCTVPFLIRSIGASPPSRLLQNPDSKPQEIIVIIPGNPGISGFYIDFARQLHSLTNLPVWAVGHGGHERVQPVPRLSQFPHLYLLDGQVAQKKELLLTYLSGVRVFLIGHSIGCWMILKLLEDKACSEIIAAAFLTFPVFERLDSSPSAAKIIAATTYYRIPWMIGLTVLERMPIFCQKLLAQGYRWMSGIDPSQIPHVINAINPRGLRQMLFLVEDEMARLKERNNKLLKTHADKLYFYYLKSDSYAPEQYYKNLMEDIPEVQAECVRGLIHPFVIHKKFTIHVAKEVSRFFKKFLK